MTRVWTASDPDLSALAGTARLLVALDFDGTAAPLVDEPMAARALPSVRRQVKRLTTLPDTTVAFVSGRSMVDLRIIAEHDDTSPILLSGSHGAQFWIPGEGLIAEPEEDASLRDKLTAEATAVVAGCAGVMIEPKARGFAVHTRLAAEEAAQTAYAATNALMAARAPQWRKRHGHDVVEFSSSDAGKDAAIVALRARTGATGVLFAGDDVTDEDAMRVLGPGDLGVRVGSGPTAAALRVADPQGLAELLAALAGERGREAQ